jgi:hypothetical protein
MRALLLIGLLLLGIIAFAEEWVARSAPGIRVFVPQGHEALATALADEGAAALQRISPALDIVTPGPFPVYAYTDHVSFMRATEADPYLAGVSYRPSGSIRIDATEEGFALRQTLTHELTHSLIAQKLGERTDALPTWVDEGIAGHYTEPLTPEEQHVAGQMMQGYGTLSLDELNTAFNRTTHADTQRAAAYVQSRAMIAWLEEQRPGAVRQLLGAIQEGASFEVALQRTVGLTPEGWLRDWRGNIPLYLFLLNILASPVVYAPLAITVAILAVISTLRKRKRQEELEEQEVQQTDEPDRLEE